MRIGGAAAIASAAIVLAIPAPALANDSAAGIAATGLYLKEERSIAMESEVLRISPTRIAVEYSFRNLTDRNVTTVVAFPIPAYSYDITGNWGHPYYDDFQVRVDGRPVPHQEEVKALVDGVDHSARLERLGLPIARFDAYDDRPMGGRPPHDPRRRLSKQQLDGLIRDGLVILECPTCIAPAWSVTRTFYWTQTFPAKAVVRVEHSYTPYPSYGVTPSRPWLRRAACVPKGRFDAWNAKTSGGSWLPRFRSIDYILTTANNWRQPIGSFRLEIDGGAAEEHVFVSSCFAKDWRKIGPNRFEISRTGFVPERDLKVYFLDHGRSSD